MDNITYRLVKVCKNKMYEVSSFIHKTNAGASQTVWHIVLLYSCILFTFIYVEYMFYLNNFFMVGSIWDLYTTTEEWGLVKWWGRGGERERFGQEIIFGISFARLKKNNAYGDPSKNYLFLWLQKKQLLYSLLHRIVARI